MLMLKLSVELARGPNAEFPEKATQLALHSEISRDAQERAAAAIDSFAEGDAAMQRSAWGTAADAYRRSVALVPSKSALLNLGIVLRYTGYLLEAIDALNQALQLPSSRSMRLVDGNCWLQLGMSHQASGSFMKAHRAFEISLLIFREVGDYASQGAALINLGWQAYSRGDLNEATLCFRLALELDVMCHDRTGEARMLTALGNIDVAKGKFLDAKVTLSQALQIYEEVNSHERGEARALEGLADVALAQRQKRQALEFLGRAYAIYQHNAAEQWELAGLQRKLSLARAQ